MGGELEGLSFEHITGVTPEQARGALAVIGGRPKGERSLLVAMLGLDGAAVRSYRREH